MKNKSVLWALTKKEFLGFVNSPIAYVIIVPFLVLISFLFLRTALVLGDANLRPMVELLPWFLVVIGPALAMRSFADEQRKQTLELLFAHPVSEWTIVIAKFLGLFGFYLTMLLTTIALPLTIIFFSKPDVGLIISQYLGAAAVGSVFLAVGIATSAFIGSAVGSFLLGAAINFVLTIIGLDFIVLTVPGILGRFISELSIQNHVTNFSRGVFDLRDFLYFLTLVGVALAAAVIRLSERKVTESKAEKSKLYLIMGLIIGVGLMGNILMYEYPIQLDLTKDHRYSLSAGTKKLLKDLPDRVAITLYASDNLPGPMQITLQETGDLLKDFRRFGSKLQVSSVVVGSDPTKQAEAQQKGIRQVQFNQIGSQSFQVQTGFLGLEIRYGSKTDVIDFIDDSSNLEYELARRILKLTRTTQPKIGLVQTVQNGNYSALNTLLSDQYTLVNLTETSPSTDWQNLVGVVVVDDGSNGSQATPASELKKIISNHGNVAFFEDGVSVNSQSLTGTKNTSAISDVSKDFGVTVNPDLVYDLQRNEAITLGSGTTRYIISYPFWIRPTINETKASFSALVDNVAMGWASSLNINNTNGWQVQRLLTTSKLSNVQADNFTVNPNDVSKLPEPSGKDYTVGAIATNNQQRAAVIADSQILSDDFMQNSQENQTFVANLIDWMAADPTLTSIPRRTAGRAVFVFNNPSEAQTIQIVDIALPPLVVAIGGFWWLQRRKKLTHRTYQPITN